MSILVCSNRIYAVLLLALVATTSAAIADELRLDARRLIDQSVSQDLRLSSDGKSIELERGELFEDDGPAAGYSYRKNEETLNVATQIKKELLIPNPRATTATLLVGSGGSLEAVVNGKPCKLEPQGKAGNYWQAFRFPPDLLTAGKNEFVLSGTGKLWIARDEDFAAGSRTRVKHPNRSAKSADRGKTWNYENLGTGNDVDGEYYVRVYLDHFRPRGTLTLPVVDAANLAGKVVAPPVTTLGQVRVKVSGEEGKGKVIVRARTGPSLSPHAKDWSAWQKLGSSGGTIEKPAGRFIQIALEISAIDPLDTPRVSQLAIEASPERPADWTQNLRVVASKNERIVRSSIPFEYEPHDQVALKTLREKYKLDDVVKGATGELEIATRLAAWSARQWEKGHLGECYPAWNALEILAPHGDGRPMGGFCQQYNLVFLQACESFGLVGRCVSIGPGEKAEKIRGGHEVVEIWSNEHRKWVYIDGNAGWYFVDGATRMPLSLLELRERQLPALRGEAAPATEIVKLAETRETWKGLDSWPPFVELRLIPRSNFLETAAPLPLNQGMRGWFWTGHYVWTDEAGPAALLYGNRVSHRPSWDWTLHQAAFALAAGDTPGELAVCLDTETPNFDTFVARLDGAPASPVAAKFTWKLKAGQTRLEVWPRNKSGRDGIAGSVALEYRP